MKKSSPIARSSLLLTAFVFSCFQGAVNANDSKRNFWTEGENSRVEVGPDILKLNQTFSDLATKLSPSVVSLSVKSQTQRGSRGQHDIFRYFFGNPFGAPGQQPEPRQAQSAGSGFVLNTDGYIVTNSHVITQGGRTADEVYAKFGNDPANFPGWPAEIVGMDPTSDVAVIKLKEKPDNLIPAVLGKSAELKVGEWVIAIGNPYGHSHSVTSGIVSALGRSIELGTRTDFIQTDASINPGNSGGPLFDIRGRVIGINTAIDARANGIGFAIPIDIAKNVIRQLITKGKVDLGWIGIYMADLTPGVARQLGLNLQGGVLIQDVIPGGPAEKAGMRSYDVITEVDGVPVMQTGDLLRLIANKSAGDKAKIKLNRDGKNEEITVTIARRKTEQELASDRRERLEERLSNSKGLLLEDLTPGSRRMLGLGAGVKGALVQDLMRDSAAARAGVRAGDVVVEINRKKVDSAKAAEAELKKAKDAMLLKILREDETIIILVEL